MLYGTKLLIRFRSRIKWDKVMRRKEAREMRAKIVDCLEIIMLPAIEILRVKTRPAAVAANTTNTKPQPTA